MPPEASVNDTCLIFLSGLHRIAQLHMAPSDNTNVFIVYAGSVIFPKAWRVIVL